MIRIHELIKSNLKISINELARLTGISRCGLSRFFSGKQELQSGNIDKINQVINIYKTQENEQDKNNS